MNKATCIALTLALAALVVAGCGNGGYKPPPKANAPKKSTGGDTTPKGPGPSGPSMEGEYTAAAKQAIAAREAFRKDKTADNFAIWGARIYDALRFQIIHSRNGRSTEGFYHIKEIKEMKTDFLKTFGPKGWHDNEEYQKAKKAYDEIQQEG